MAQSAGSLFFLSGSLRRVLSKSRMSRPIPLNVKMSFLLTPAEIQEKNRLPAVHIWLYHFL